MSDHYVTVTAQYRNDGTELTPDVKFECRAREDAPCHQFPDCDCEYWDDDHEHETVQQDECWMKGWFDGGGHNYEGDDADDMGDYGLPPGMNRSGPIKPLFEVEYLAWQYEEAVPTGAASLIQEDS